MTAGGEELVLEVAKRNAKLAAGRQVCVIAPPSCVLRARADTCS